MKENDLAFFQPLWRRVAITVFCAFWAMLEWLTQAPFWGMIATGMTAYCYWTLFHTFTPLNDHPDESP
ncbi:hypothetical protein [Hahella ganghwensis]|uniref:hypothetical protein n=1 Tax=Hahella ganghwensis TaxID=286420 RepID=UPI000365A087|nr:hypothetical protein [Hahella ganghwensis]